MKHGRVLLIGLVMALLGSVLLVHAVAADLIAHPAAIHDGSCVEMGDIVGMLDDVVGEATGAPAMGSAAAIPVEASVTTAVPLTYARLFASPHSIVVAQGPGDADLAIQIVCGDLGGHELTATDFAIGLGELDASGYSGIATIHDDGDGTVTVAIYISTDLTPASAPAATPAP